MMEFIANTRGGKKLCYAGHSYTLKAKSKTIQRNDREFSKRVFDDRQDN